jgi:serine/threonine protein phosphatase PrpC
MLQGWPVVGTAVADDTDVGRVGRLAAQAADHQGFAPADVTRVMRAATQLATHAVAHGRAGRVLVRFAQWDERRGVELVSTDSVEAGADLTLLHPAELVSDLFEVYSVPGMGTVMLARLWGSPQTSPADRRYAVGSMAEPYPGELVSGDAWAVEQHGPRAVALVADGLGHGEQAAVASAAAVSAFRQHHAQPVEVIAAALHRALRSTRGAAIALAEIDSDAGLVRFCGIGNISARLLSANRVHELISLYGIAGYQRQRFQTFTQPWPDDAMLVLHSDGLSSTWDVAAYPELRLQHPQLVAASLMRDATRARDDALVVAIRGVDQAAQATVPGAD